MGQQIIKQPDGHFAIFSSVTDTIWVWDATADEIVEWFADRAAEEARRHAREKLDLLESGSPRPYFQFTKSWDEALDADREHGGTVSADLAED